MQFMNLESLLSSDAQKRLDDEGLKVDLVNPKLEQDLPFQLEGATFTVRGEVQVGAFNSQDDKDVDGILGMSPDGGELELSPQIIFDSGKAWIKYRALAAAKASGGGSIGNLGFSFEAERGVVIGSYRLHARDEKLLAAVLSDIATPRFALSRNHIRDLQVGEAASFQVVGSLAGTLILSWADIFSSQMNLLAGLLETNEMLRIQVGASLTAKLKVSLKDDYIVVFSRADATTFRIALRKSDQKALEAAVSLDVAAELANPDVISEVLNPVIEGLAGEPVATIDRILSVATLEELDPSARSILSKVVDRLGFGEVADDLLALRDRWLSFQEKVKKTIKAAAETKAELSVFYEYSRVRTNTSILQARVRDTDVDSFHGSLLKGKLEDILAAIRAGSPSVSLELFLNQSTLKHINAWGATLGIGKFRLAGHAEDEIEEIRRATENGRVQLSFSGARSYEREENGDLVKWLVDFDAGMAEFSTPGEPTADQFSYSLYLAFRWAEKKVTGNEIARLVDHAVLWMAVAQGAAKEQIESLSSVLEGKSDVEFACQLMFRKEVFEKILPFIARKVELNQDRFAMALGAAMPWSDVVPEVGQIVELRRKYYGALWRSYLTNPGITPAALAEIALRSFKEWGFDGLGRFEGKSWKIARTTTIAGLAEINSRTRQQWKSFVRGAGALHEARELKLPYSEIKSAWHMMNDLWKQSHHVRALGRHLLETVKEDFPELKGHVERVLTVKYEEDGEEHTINVSLS